MYNLNSFTDRQLSELRTLVEEMVDAKVDEIFDKIQAKKKTQKESDLFKKERLTQKEVCELFEVSKLTVNRWEKRGFIKGEKQGRNKIYLKKKLLDFLEYDRIISGRNDIKSTSPYYRVLHKT